MLYKLKIFIMQIKNELLHSQITFICKIFALIDRYVYSIIHQERPSGDPTYSYELDLSLCLFVCLFGVLRRFQHCTGHITTGSWKGRGNQYI